MPYGIFAVAIATVLFPALSRHAADENMKGFVGDMSLGFRWTMFIMLPISIGIATLALPLTRVLFEHRGGQFTYSDSLFTASFLRYYALSIFPYAILMFATRTFYALKDTVSPAYINIGGVIFNAVLSYVLLKAMGASGIALAATISYLLTMSVSFMVLKKKVKSLDGRIMLRSALKMGTAVVLMAIAVQSMDMYLRPDVVVMERGSRFSLRVPSESARGNVILVNDQASFKNFWKASGRKESLLPDVNFTHSTIALVVGPSSRTTSALNLENSAISNQGLLSVKADVTTSTRTASRSTSATVLADLPTSPAYMMLKINHKAAKAQLSLDIGKPAKVKSWWQILDGEIMQLLLLIAVGAAVYFISNIFLGTEELYSFGRLIKKKLMRSRG